MSVLGTRRFSLADQERFAALSGDWNPIHVDPDAARRTLFGEPVVHGVHHVTWALDLYAARRPAAPPSRVAVTFGKPAFLGEEIAAELAKETEQGARLRVVHGAVALADVRLSYGGAATGRGPDDGERRASGEYPRTTPKPRTLADLDGLSGTLEVHGGDDDGAIARAFPALASALGPATVAQLLALSRLVGMEAPGLHSLFSSFDVEIVGDGPGDRLAFAVARADPRFSMAQIEVSGGRLRGTVTAFVRPAPAEQPPMAAVAGAVRAGEFAGQRALVVGGSRGLGELTAKIVAAGGGHPVVTYRSGAEEAERLAAEIRAAGGRCDTLRLDVADPSGPIAALAATGWAPAHLYYFATPPIFARKAALFEPPIFRRFLAVYVDGFLETYRACRSAAPGPLRIFYPSTVFVDEPPREFGEYVAAKVAGEALCRQIDAFERDVRVLVERLPRLPTDQTTSITAAGAPAADPLPVLLRVVRELARS